jgi:hypothetical protein
MNYHFEDTLTARDCKRHIPHRFTLPDGSRQIDIHLRFAPFKVHGSQNMLTLTIFDSDRLPRRGTQIGRLAPRADQCRRGHAWLSAGRVAGRRVDRTDRHTHDHAGGATHLHPRHRHQPGQRRSAGISANLRPAGCAPSNARRRLVSRRFAQPHPPLRRRRTHVARAAAGGARGWAGLHLPHRSQYRFGVGGNGRICERRAIHGRRHRVDDILGARALPRRQGVDRLAGAPRHR